MSEAVSGTLVHHHAHHFASAEAEFEAAKQGMWLFLVTEVLMLGAIFMAFGIFRGLNLEAFKEAHRDLSVTLGTTNTLVLITSSVTMLLGVTSAQRGRRDRSIVFLILTLVLACMFLCIKYVEWSTDFRHGIFPGGFFHNAPSHKYALFFTFYFVMTGIHGLHVLIGMGLITWILR